MSSFFPDQQQHDQAQFQRQFDPPPAGQFGGVWDSLGSGSAFLNNSTAVQFATGMGQQFGQQYLGEASKQWSGWMKQSNLRYYFCVSNGYVLRKLRLILLPISYRGQWARRLTDDGASYLPPKEDDFAPDLYIPLMAFLTYVLLVGLIMGLHHEFRPEILGVTASTGLVAIAFEVIVLKLGFYMLNAASLSLLDMLAFSGYVYVGIAITQFAGVLLGQLAFYVIMAVTSVMSALFIIRMIKAYVPDNRMAAGEYSKSFFGDNRRNYFILFIAVLQIVYSYFLSQPPRNTFI